MKRGWFVQRPGIALAVVNPRQVRDFAHDLFDYALTLNHKEVQQR